MTIESAMDGITRMVGNPLIIPAGLAAIVILYGLFGVDVANIAISIATFLLLPILQHSQNRDGIAIQAKLDALIKGVPDAPNDMAGIDRLSATEVERKRQECP